MSYHVDALRRAGEVYIKSWQGLLRFVAVKRKVDGQPACSRTVPKGQYGHCWRGRTRTPKYVP